MRSCHNITVNLPLKINFGCGNKLLNGYINVDKEEYDLNKLPLNIPSNFYDEVMCSHVIEHLTSDINELINEFSRIIKPNGRIIIKVPHFSWHNAYDETHTKFFNINSFSNIYKNSIQRDNYKKYKVKRKILFYKNWRIWEYPIEYIINQSKRLAIIWESTILVNLFPANQIKFIIKLKGGRKNVRLPK